LLCHDPSRQKHHSGSGQVVNKQSVLHMFHQKPKYTAWSQLTQVGARDAFDLRMTRAFLFVVAAGAVDLCNKVFLPVEPFGQVEIKIGKIGTDCLFS